MKKHRFALIAMGFCILILLLLILFIRGTSRQRSHMELPDDSAGLPGGEEEPDSSASLSIVEITPETVQQAVATMARPAAYVRTVRITTHWSGGSRTVDVQTAVREPYTRTDVQTPKVFKMSELIANGDNYGLKQADWKPVVGTIHPNCMCPLNVMPPGTKFDSQGNLVPDK